MSTIGTGQPVQYIPGVTSVPQNTTVNPVNNNPQTTVNTQSSQGGYPYSEDVFQGQYQQFKGLYQNFDKN